MASISTGSLPRSRSRNAFTGPAPVALALARRRTGPSGPDGRRSRRPVPLSATVPAVSTVACVASERPKRTFCSTIRIVVPAAIIARTLSPMIARLAGSRPSVGSSSSTTVGSSIRARANSTIRRCPPDSVPAEDTGPGREDREGLGKRVVAALEVLAPLPDHVAAHQHVLPDGQPGEQAVPLRDLRDARAQDRPRVSPGQVGAVDADRARRGPQDAAHRFSARWTCPRRSARRCR